MSVPSPAVAVQGQGALGADQINGLVQTVASVAQLRGFSGVTTMVVLLDGTNAVADGGQGFFYWSPNATAADNGSTVIAPSGSVGAGRWLRFAVGGGGAYPVILPTGGDDTASLQAALTTGGIWYLQSATYNYTSLTATAPVRLVGGNQSTGAPATVLNCTANNSADKIVAGGAIAQLDGVEFESITFKAASATGGSIIFFNNCADSAVRDSQFVSLGQTAVGIKVNQCNSIRIYDTRIVNPTQAGLYAYGGNTTRTDVIDVINFIVSGNSISGATFLPAGIELDGFVNTVTGTSWKFVACGRGLWRHNAVGATIRAEYVIVHDMEVDFPYYEALRVDYGDGFWFSNVYMHGSVTTNNVFIATASPNSITNLSFIGGQCTGAALNGMYLNGDYTRIQGMIITDNSLSSVGTYNGVEIGPNSIAVMLTGNQIGQESGYVGATQKYGVQIDNGAVEYVVAYNDLTGNVTAGMNNLSQTDANSAAIALPNLGMGALPGSIAVIAPVTGFVISLGPAGGQYNVQSMSLVPAGTLATGQVNLPTQPFTGQLFELFTTQIITAFTLTPAAGQSLNSNVTTLAANGSFAYRFQQTAGSAVGTGQWMRVR